MAESHIAEVIVRHPDFPLTPTVREVGSVEVSVESQPFTHPDSPRIYYSATGTTFGRMEAALSRDRTVEGWQTVAKFPDRRIYRVTPSSEAKFTIPKITELGLRVLAIRSTDRGWHFQIHAPAKDALGAYWEYCREEGVEFSLEKLYTSEPRPATFADAGLPARLTDRQREVARTAYRMGYFDPDGASAVEVADELGISPSTLSTHLRRVTAKAFDHMFEGE